jgi:hypothetical protein
MELKQPQKGLAACKEVQHAQKNGSFSGLPFRNFKI